MNYSPGKLYQIPKYLFLLCYLLLLSTLWGQELVYQNSRIELYATRDIGSALPHTMQLLDERIQDFEMKLGIYPGAKCKIVLVSSADEYQKLSIGKAAIVESSAAFYDSEAGKIFIRSSDQVEDNYLKLLMHEYLHWFVEELFVAAPLWFHEGMATIYSNQLGYERYLMYIRHSFWGQKGELFKHSYQYPANKEDWAAFYQFSAMALRYMETKYPNEWQLFWARVAMVHKAGHRIHFNDAFIPSYLLSLYDFNQRFEDYSRQQGYLHLFVGFNSLIFLLLAVSIPFIAAKRKAKMRRLPDLELPAEPEEEAIEPDTEEDLP